MNATTLNARVSQHIGVLLSSIVLACASIPLPAQAATYRFNFTVVNNSSTAINAFCISPTYDSRFRCVSNWKRLYNGYRQNAWIVINKSTCYFDYKAFFSDGNVLETHSINLCRSNWITFYDKY
jgi:hypothetical protein